MVAAPSTPGSHNLRMSPPKSEPLICLSRVTEITPLHLDAQSRSRVNSRVTHSHCYSSTNLQPETELGNQSCGSLHH